MLLARSLSALVLSFLIHMVRVPASLRLCDEHPSWGVLQGQPQLSPFFWMPVCGWGCQRGSGVLSFPTLF